MSPLDQIVPALLRLDRQPVQAGPRKVTGLATGFYKLDGMTSGLQKGELIIIAARPSMGKTALAINIAQNAAVSSNAMVAIFSLEMSKESLLRRMLASQAWVDQRKTADRVIWAARTATSCSNALGSLVEARIFIDDTAGISLAEMRAKARRLKQKAGGLDLVVVDYLQLMSATLASAGGKRYENRTQEVSAISRGLKALAKELDVPVVALSQLSRASERRGDDKRPMLSDLRESGSIEQDADVVAFIHRDSYYNRDEEMTEAEKAKSEIILAKQRNGPTRHRRHVLHRAVHALRKPGPTARSLEFTAHSESARRGPRSGRWATRRARFRSGPRERRCCAGRKTSRLARKST